MPVFFLYFSSHLSVGKVLLLEGIYYAAVVVFEVPSGYFSDRVGRKRTLLLSSGALVVAYLLFFFGSTFNEFVFAQIMLAGGIAFNSGTDTSLHYDSLADLGRETEYAERESVVARNSLVATGAAALLGGAVATFGLQYAYALSAITALTCLFVALSFVEPGSDDSEISTGFIRQIGDCLGLLRNPLLRWLFGFEVLMVVLNHIPYKFYQPYLGLLNSGTAFNSKTALAAGAHMAAATFVAAWFARRSARVTEHIGIQRVLLAAATIQLFIIGVMGLILHPVVLLLVLFRGVPSGLSRAPLNAAVTPRVPKRQRATYLSIQSLVGRLVFSMFLIGLSNAVVAPVGTWPVLSSLLLRSVIVAGFGLVLLSISSINPKSSQS